MMRFQVGAVVVGNKKANQFVGRTGTVIDVRPRHIRIKFHRLTYSYEAAYAGVWMHDWQFDHVHQKERDEQWIA